MSTIPKDAFVLLIGAMKSGTSFVFDALARHPAIAGSTPKETEFFSSPGQLHRVRIDTLDQYERLFGFDPAQHRYALDGSTGYTKYPREGRVPETIAAHGLQPRFIYVVRDPVRRLESQYRFGQGFSWGQNPSHLDEELLCNSNYLLQLSRYRPFFPRERFYVMKFEDVVADPAAAFDAVFEWLGLEPLPYEPLEAVNVTPRISRVESLLARRAPGLARALPFRARRVLRRIGPCEDVPGLTAEQRAEIRDRLRDDTLRFGDEYGVDVTSWGF